MDGNHRFEKAFRDDKKSKGYEVFEKYWNSKLDEQ